MKIVPILLKFKLLYEHRHLYTDDYQYNSLIISKLVNKQIFLLELCRYDEFDFEYKLQLYHDYDDHNYILVKEGVYKIFDKEGNVEDVCEFIHWDEFDSFFEIDKEPDHIDFFNIYI